MFRTSLFKKKNKPDKDKPIMELGDNFYVEFDHVSNMMGGHHPVNIWLKNRKDKKCNYQITDAFGYFVKFPGVVEGKWEKELDGILHPAVRFTFSASKFVNGISYIIWLVQPDGRYFADEDGFGAEHFSEIELYSQMNTKGEFVCPFTEERFEGCDGCYTLYG